MKKRFILTVRSEDIDDRTRIQLSATVRSTTLAELNHRSDDLVIESRFDDVIASYKTALEVRDIPYTFEDASEQERKYGLLSGRNGYVYTTLRMAPSDAKARNLKAREARSAGRWVIIREEARV